ncbi:hypothetical protein [Haladaptatus sp. R4]|uniref:hypothetical protein n=1 Tax=Haladaptatus sp. R4 TaxID=1679489 RepID=UPI001CBFC1F9|nr:hypothetical protein [Haladaptatus sp. R4]
MRNRVPRRWWLLRMLLLFAFLAGGRGILGGKKLQDVPYVPGTNNTLVLVALVGAVVLIGGVLAYRAGALPGTSSASETEVHPPDDGYNCRYCGRNLERYRNRCPYCETRDPVGNEDW